MASISVYFPNCISPSNGVVSFSRNLSSFSPFELTLFGSKIRTSTLSSSLSIDETRKSRPRPACFSAMDPVNSSCSHFDVVIVGAGIIGLTIARQFLIGSDLSVAVVDKAVPCFGATGAGQGYIWIVHKIPGSETWELTKRSHQLWELLAEDILQQGLDPLQVLGWKKTGSLLVGKSPEESVMLKKKVKQLSEAGLRVEYLSSSDLLSREPDLFVGSEGGAVFLPDDCQLDAHRTASYIEKVNRHYASEGRYAEFYHEPVTGLVRSVSSGDIEAVQTPSNTLYGRKAIVIAAGCWSGSLMQELVRGSDIELVVPVKPRKGHLLVLENFDALRLNHGLMEVGYVDHQIAKVSLGLDNQEKALSVSMTATMDATGNLVLGSSRQFAGFDTAVDESVIHNIWKRAGDFFPKLKELSLKDFIKNRKVRIGLRPYMPDGKPVIGPVPHLSKVFLATGHEGVGLSMALGTAEMIVDLVLGNPSVVDNERFSVQGRCS